MQRTAAVPAPAVGGANAPAPACLRAAAEADTSSVTAAIDSTSLAWVPTGVPPDEETVVIAARASAASAARQLCCVSSHTKPPPRCQQAKALSPTDIQQPEMRRTRHGRWLVGGAGLSLPFASPPPPVRVPLRVPLPEAPLLFDALWLWLWFWLWWLSSSSSLLF
jgi:hypothetical protein